MFRFDFHEPIVCELPAWTPIAVTGTDATSFLQGQFTNDISELAAGALHFNGYCSPKGRMLANFPLGRTAEEEYLLVVPADIAPGLVRRLRMFVLRAKVLVSALDESHSLFGLRRPADAAKPGVTRESGVTRLELPDGRTMVVCERERAPAFRNDIAQKAAPAGSQFWDWLSIREGIPVITTPTADRFVPQMLNWEQLRGVSFRKGCYPGQEIVARMQYLGRLKERLFRAHVDATGVAAGASLHGRQFGDQACGTVVNAAGAPEGGTDLLAVIQVSAAASDVIRLAQRDEGPALEFLPLPYAVPQELAAGRQ